MKKFAFILVISCLNSIYTYSHSNNNLKKPSPIGEESWRLIEDWKNANEKNNTIYTKRSLQEWQYIFEKKYQNIFDIKEPKLHNKFGLILATIYHNLTYFEKELPILEKIYLQKKHLDTKEYNSLLIKLEEVYRSKNQLSNALKIRKERIENKFINTYWEIYRDCGLLEAAKKDFLAFEPLPPLFSERRLYYYAFLGGLLIEMNEIDSARNVLKTGLKEAKIAIEKNKESAVYSEENLQFWEGNLVGQLAQCDILQNKFKGTITKLNYNLSTIGVNIDNKILTLIILAEAYIHYKDFLNAEKSLDTALILMKGKTLKNIQSNYLKVKANYFKAINQIDSANIYLRHYIQYKDTLHVNIQKNQSVLLLAELEINNRRNELLNSKKNLALIEQLNKKQSIQLIWLGVSLVFSILFGAALIVNIKIKNKNKRHVLSQNEQLKINAQILEEQYNHNEILLKELHHRVKNNLQVIYSLLNIQKRRNSDLELKETISAIQTRIQTMALVHQNLYQSENLEKVDVKYYVKNLVTHLQSLYKIDERIVQIEFDIQSPLELNIEKIIPLGLIINEAVSNAFKHAFTKREKGLLQIKIKQFENTLFMEIMDNGPGFNQEDIKENSIGLQLIQIMSKQLNSVYKVEQVSGVTHKIEFNI